MNIQSRRQIKILTEDSQWDISIVFCTNVQGWLGNKAKYNYVAFVKLS